MDQGQIDAIKEMSANKDLPHKCEFCDDPAKVQMAGLYLCPICTMEVC